jgi:hypothetical protein
VSYRSLSQYWDAMGGDPELDLLNNDEELLRREAEAGAGGEETEGATPEDKKIF